MCLVFADFSAIMRENMKHVILSVMIRLNHIAIYKYKVSLLRNYILSLNQLINSIFKWQCLHLQ